MPIKKVQLFGEKEVSSSATSVSGFVSRSDDTQTKIAQMESTLKALEEKTTSQTSLRKWLFGITLTTIAIAFAVLSFVVGFFIDTITGYRELQNSYYQELLDVNKNLLKLQNNNGVKDTPVNK